MSSLESHIFSMSSASSFLWTGALSCQQEFGVDVALLEQVLQPLEPQVQKAQHVVLKHDKRPQTKSTRPVNAFQNKAATREMA
ncbi:hypothetical protein EYF80_041021 [Liparis tanakae]|uniref:Uncharacterized protein n=1 Tax=Liparis tanakae TaxID=230148 RepID=A0A4Z2G865_9TELE|nr:hypothetical protein EYF80_041021 [Liparis tanakae]